MNTAVLGIGSNYCSESNIQTASEILTQYFTNIRFSKPLFTNPVNIPNPVPFLNCTAILNTQSDYTEVSSILKSIEKILGRAPEHKKLHKIIIDIDLLQWNNTPLKSDDLQQPYTQIGLQELGIL